MLIEHVQSQIALEHEPAKRRVGAVLADQSLPTRRYGVGLANELDVELSMPVVVELRARAAAWRRRGACGRRSCKRGNGELRIDGTHGPEFSLIAARSETGENSALGDSYRPRRRDRARTSLLVTPRA